MIKTEQYIPITGFHCNQAKYHLQSCMNYNNIMLSLRYEHSGYYLYAKPVEVKKIGRERYVGSGMNGTVWRYLCRANDRNYKHKIKLAVKIAQELAPEVLEELNNDWGIECEMPDRFFIKEVA